VHQLAFAIIHSTTIALPAWHLACQSHHLPIRLIPHDIITCWNSTYTMMAFTLKYRE
ncbi:hypothetical protein JAAARDRAFT_115571, partial [Jaapia argillacea MUCL 33604]